MSDFTNKLDTFTARAVLVGVTFFFVVGSLIFGIYSDVESHRAAVAAASAASLAAKEAKSLRVLLTDGKTSSAVSAKKTEEEAKAGDVVINHIESQLNEILSRSDINRQLVCSIASVVHVTSATITTYCSAS